MTVSLSVEPKPSPVAAFEAEASVQTAAAPRILIVEDDQAVQKILRRLFEAEGYLVDVAPDGATGLTLFHSGSPDVIVLDLRLPEMSGYDVCREVTRLDPQLPIVILSAQADTVSKVSLLEIGALDYVTKPFSPRELLARVRAVIRRSTQASAGDVLTFGELQIAISRMEVRRRGELVPLTPQEFRTLLFLVRRPYNVVTREDLLREVWGYSHFNTRTADQHILTLRHKLERDPSNPAHLQTVHRVGYKFVP